MQHDPQSQSVTSLSLLVRLRDHPDDTSGWDDFVARYGRRIEAWCSKWGLQEADAQDVTQNVLLTLSKQMQRFEYRPGGRFRAWLRTVVYRAWCGFLEHRQKQGLQTADSQMLSRLESEAAQDDLLQTMIDECDRELMEVAMKNVQPRVKPHNWQAFQLMTFEEHTAPQVAETLRISETSAYVACTRVRKMLVDEVERLDRMNHE